MLTQKQKEILTDLVIDNGIIYEESKSALYYTNLCAFERLQSVINYCHSLFIECAYNAANDNADYIENRLVNLLAGVSRYRRSYEVGTNLIHFSIKLQKHLLILEIRYENDLLRRVSWR